VVVRIPPRRWDTDKINGAIEKILSRGSSSSSGGGGGSSSRRVEEDFTGYDEMAKEMEAGQVELEVDMRR